MIISKTPFRISFVGGGSDLPAFYERGYGAVISSAIDKFVYLALHEFFDRRYLLKYAQTETCESIDAIRHPLIRECLRNTGNQDFLEITSFADIPSMGSGLGGSSAFSVGLINALLARQGRLPSHENCAARACEVELVQLAEPIGKQDQYAAAFGGMNYLRFNPDGTVDVEPLVLSADLRGALEQRLVLFYTGVTRSAVTILSEQRRNILDDQKVFDTLCRMRDQADRLRQELVAGNLSAVGAEMHQGWLLKRQMASGVSSPFFDQIYERGRAAGASGGKLLGAGGGGFFLFYVEPERREAVIDSLGELRHLDFCLERQGTRIIYVGD
jgi:D-glycero-alpha-D-manno-heptose-7-phosphate kinase